MVLTLPARSVTLASLVSIRNSGAVPTLKVLLHSSASMGEAAIAPRAHAHEIALNILNIFSLTINTR